VSIPFDAANFSNGTIIDNAYWPLTKFNGPFTYVAVADDECEFNKVSFTGETEYLAEVDVTAAVFRDQAWVAPRNENGECDTGSAQLVEDTIDFYAQDDDGNLWYLGEKTWKPVETSNQCSDEGSWLAGLPVGDPDTPPAQPGIVMLAKPKPGDRYQQEFSPDVAEDAAAVLRTNATVSMGAEKYTDCLVTKEWSPLEPGAVEKKYYCRRPKDGPGLVLIDELSGGKTLHVRFVDSELFPGGLPGDGATFPATTQLGCSIP